MMFHYTSQKGFEGIVKEDGIHLWFSDARYMNDSSELLNAKKFLDQAAEELYKNGDIPVNLYKNITRLRYHTNKLSKTNFYDHKTNKMSVNFQSLDHHIYVCCFSQESDSLPMWNYYLKNESNGYAVGLELNSIDTLTYDIIGKVKNIDDFEFDNKISAVLYSDDIKVNLIKNKIIEISKLMEDSSQDEIVQCMPLVLLKSTLEEYSIIFKDYHFAYEKEIRMMATVKKSAPYIDGKRRDDIKFRLSHGLVIPYFELLIPDKKVLKAVSISPRIGLNSDDESAIESMRVYLEHLGYTHDIEIRCSEIPLRYY